MTFVDAIAHGFKNYANFKGRASRSEFWYWFLFTVLLNLVLGTLDVGFSAGSGTLQNVGSLVLALPNIAVSVRRFRDAGVNPWLNLLQLVPIGLVIWLLVQVVVLVLSAPAFPDQQSLENALAQFEATQDGPLADFILNGGLNTLMVPLAVTAAVSVAVGIFFIVVYVRKSKPETEGSSNNAGVAFP